MNVAIPSEAGIYDHHASLPSGDPGAQIRAKIMSGQRRDRRFFLTLAILAAFMVFWGFSGTYYFKPLKAVGALPQSPKLALLVHIHGAAFTLYVLFYVFQTALISQGRRALHMALGWASLVLIPALIVLATSTALYCAKMGHKQIWPDAEIAALVNLAPVYPFAVLASAGVLLRKKPEAHRRLMSLSFMTLLPPAIARTHLGALGPQAVTIAIFAFILAGPLYDLVTRRRIHPAYLFGVLLFLTTPPPMMVALGSTPAWHHFVHWVNGA